MMQDSDIQRAREYPIRRLWADLGLPEIPAKGNTHSPWREDQDPSVQVGGEKNIVTDYGTNETLDTIALVQKVRGCDFPEAVRFIVGAQPAAKPSSKGGRVYQTLKEALHAVVGMTQGKLVANWKYCQADGSLVFSVIRLQTPTGKTYRPVHHTQAGWVIGDPPGPLPLYHLPELLRTSGRVYLFEGELCADTGAGLGWLSTTSAHGAQSAAKTDWQPLAGREVVIFPDNDQSGTEYMEKVLASLRKLDPPSQVKVVHLPDLSTGEDIVDYVQRRKADGLDDPAIRLEIEALIEQAPFVADQQQAKPLGTLLADIEAKAVEWLWSGRIPYGKLSIIDGDPGVNKSTLTCDLGARVSTGRAMPDDDDTGSGQPGGVILLSAEDDPADTIRPRFEAAGADLTRISVIQMVPDTKKEADGERPPVIPDDIPLIESEIRRLKAKVVFIDPVMAYLDSSVQAFRDQDVRRALHPLAAMAERTGVAAVAVRHLNKMSGGQAIYRGGGSIGIIGAARAGLLVAKDPDDEDARIVAVVKSNLAKIPPALRFHVEEAESGAPYIVWEGQTNYTAGDLLACPQSGEERSAFDEAKDYLLDLLAGGPVAQKKIVGTAKGLGISEKTLRRAKTALNIESTKGGLKDGWAWSLPDVLSPKMANISEDGHQSG